MIGITIWLLVNVGWGYGDQVLVVERFVSGQECERVASVIRTSTRGTLRCVQATVVKP